uniref:Uncharacterized protein n=1 Tax=Cruciviridae sp. TaxID=1955495 RepID=A0A1S6LVG1_9VIRU|nr:hypothetical protein [Cruciviridae sp.]
MQSSVPKKNLPEINFQDPCVELHIRIPEKMDPDRIEKIFSKIFSQSPNLQEKYRIVPPSLAPQSREDPQTPTSIVQSFDDLPEHPDTPHRAGECWDSSVHPYADVEDLVNDNHLHNYKEIFDKIPNLLWDIRNPKVFPVLYPLLFVYMDQLETEHKRIMDKLRLYIQEYGQYHDKTK